ncbi:glycine--tRNA ligase subunit beta [Hyphomonas jannaschiana]|uniref:Glycine--tRNA ligase beta subunit n=1 Tax=Hyphomonas jannaschiana VP2 TaxID=1280952 RepID=A0A059FBR9_9PROT|nr:glycine--tRNA ligase subunit beta [Hyphomonas jannaschiana]KCZ88006.1 glycyl-tRNA ligase subunit beta [Hyphomonas jannaschiana VP2]
MAELLLELFSEEIPARMQAKAEADLRDAMEKALKEAGLKWKLLAACSGPRRLTVSITGLSERSADVKEERKGPKVGAPDKAVEGFLRGAGLSDISQAEVRSDPKKGDFYVAVIETPGRDAKDIIAEAVPAIIRSFHWPKSMRWGTGDLRWVRPLQRITCVLEGAVVPFDVDGIASGNQVEGHRVHGRGPYTVTGWEDYSKQLEGAGHVKLTRADRRDVILKGIQEVCKKAGLEWIEDQGLLEEVTGLAEWPVVVLGDMDPDFLSLPPEVIQLSMRTHQKYFAVNDARTGKLAPHFIVVANIDAADGGKKLAEGNSRVLSARLDDARFFWDLDKAKPLDEMAEKLSTIAFKAELGSLGDKVERVAALAKELAPKVGADPDLAERAARLAKADLVSEMVGEFPELQGVMGRYYALEAGEPAAVADAIRDHYKPQGPSDNVPTDPVGIAVALADKFDTLVGFWAIDEKPTGSKDPFALRRAALGVVRIVLENGVRLPLTDVFQKSLETNTKHFWQFGNLYWVSPLTRGDYDVPHEGLSSGPGYQVSEFTTVQHLGEWQAECGHPGELVVVDGIWSGNGVLPETRKKEFDAHLKFRLANICGVTPDLISFLADRLKQYLRDQGQRHDLIDAVFALGEDDLVLITKRVEALGAFLGTEDGANLLAGYKRAANILKAEEKKGALPETLEVDGALIDAGADQEIALHQTLGQVRHDIEEPLKNEDFAAVMTELAKLRGPVDAFFEHVMVNDEDQKVRANRLALLADIRDTLHRVADFSQIEG